MIDIKDHILKTGSHSSHITFDQSPNHSGIFAEGLPDTVVIHYTAGSSLESSVSWLKTPQAKASAHIVVGKSGNIVQLVPFNTKAWHAGSSKWKGRSGMNHFSIGIEIDNGGLLEKRADGFYTHFGKRIDNSQVVLAPHKNGGSEQAWEAYTEKQIETVEKICLSLKSNYPISEIVGHDDISPGRKTDPGPAFPLAALKNRVLWGRKDDEATSVTNQEISPGLVSADYLNIRMQPNGNANLVSDPLPKGTKLRIINHAGNWLKVKVDIEGWVSRNWVEEI